MAQKQPVSFDFEVCDSTKDFLDDFVGDFFGIVSLLYDRFSVSYLGSIVKTFKTCYSEGCF